MTVLKVIEEAKQTFADFSWPLLNRLLPGGIQRFDIAVQLADGNEYYGFRKNLWEASSTRYKVFGMGWQRADYSWCRENYSLRVPRMATIGSKS
jgi:hypothetical protein